MGAVCSTLMARSPEAEALPDERSLSTVEIYSLEVTLPHGGVLRGREVQQNAAPPFQAFLGVPFARPPLGRLRFQPPQPAEPWAGVLPAEQERPPPLQIDYYLKKVVGSEDCLYLNVYRPPGTEASSRKPVLVYFHYGMWSLNNSSMNEVGPELFVAKDIVVVVINYRLLAFGFMSLNTPLAPGNMGLKDAVLGMRWVRENIAAFGGDPERVTAFGFCIGAYIAHTLQFVEAAKGTFQRSMIFSGAMNNTWYGALPGEVLRERTLKLARILGCDEKASDEEVFEFLQSVPAMELFGKSWDCMASPPPADRANPPFLPVIDGHCVARPEDAVFPAHPFKMLRDGMQVSPVPTMFSLARDDGHVIRGDTKLWTGNRVDEDKLDDHYAKLDRSLPYDLDLELGTPERAAVTREVRQLYFDNKRHPTMHQMYTYLGDVFSGMPVVRAARLHAAHPAAPPTYLMNFAVESSFFNRSRVKYGKCIVPGLVVHADDMSYYFGAGAEPQGPGPEPELAHDSLEAVTRRRMMAFLSNFIKYGDPTPEDEPEPELRGLRWPRLPASSRAPYPALSFTAHPSVEWEIYGARARFWQDVYERHFTDGDTAVSRAPPSYTDPDEREDGGKAYSRGIFA
ncbi:Carboxyl/Cholinesterase 32 [Frankliniella occidentalis]|uniref:Cholinesterase 1-like isoform X1 n=2 Tax=Frankliniella occidentalis TaxID=133901 RepID=A0A6J1T3W2_FRAOC|nr:cholinesterase 1-like isoform X1 [Frankliniella occidentalis]KAE8744567.1 Carboxyl/Cholinesterase 32 [Frankliniella occidentalis]